ncbi:MAG: pyridoxamine 5'-phosphate oxidase family protein [Pseudomonadota bacterium]
MSKEMINKDYHKDLWALIEDIKVAMMVSHDGQHMRSRPMYTVQDSFEGRLWFFTHVNSEKVDEIILNEDVCIIYADTDDDKYISLSGTASLCRDRALVDQFWNPFVAAWFPEGKDSEDVGLIEVKIQKAEIWDSKKNKMIQLYEMIKANVTGHQPDIGDHRQYG